MQHDTTSAGGPAAAFAALPDRNVRLAIIDALICMSLVKQEPAGTIYERVTGEPFDEETQGYQYSSETADFYAAYPVTDAMLEAVTGLDYDASCTIVGLVWPHWDGECDTFTINSFEGIAQALPNLTSITGDLFGLTSLEPLKHCTQLAQLAIGTTDDLSPLLDLPNLQTVKLSAPESNKPVSAKLKKRTVKAKITWISDQTLLEETAFRHQQNGKRDEAIYWYTRAREYGGGHFLMDLGTLLEAQGRYAEAAEAFLEHVHFYRDRISHITQTEALHAVECLILGGERERAEHVLNEEITTCLLNKSTDAHPYHQVVRELLRLLLAETQDRAKHRQALSVLLDDNPELRYNYEAWDTALIRGIADRQGQLDQIQPFLMRLQAQKRTYNRWRECWMHIFPEPMEQAAIHRRKAAQQRARVAEAFGLNNAQPWELEIGLTDSTSRTDTPVWLSIEFHRTLGIEVEINSRSDIRVHIPDLVYLGIPLPEDYTNLPETLHLLTKEFGLCFDFSRPSIDLTSPLKGTARKAVLDRIRSWVADCGL